MDAKSKRFISAYNRIDKAIRLRCGFKPSMSFSDAVRRAAHTILAVKKHEDDLLAYSRLRNAIIHTADDNLIIAEPHDETVAKIEAIAGLILAPPLAKDYAKKAQVLNSSATLFEAVLTMSENDYSNMPVVSGGTIKGVITNKLIVNSLSRLFRAKCGTVTEFMASNSVVSALNEDSSHYQILNSNATVDEVLSCYLNNPKLQIVILTSKGFVDGRIEGVITTGDISALNKLMDAIT